MKLPHTEVKFYPEVKSQTCFCYVYVKFNEPIKIAHLQKLANQLVLNGALRNGN